MIPFNIPVITGEEQGLLNDVFLKKKFSGDGPYSQKCQKSLSEYLEAPKVLLTTSCTDALEMSAILANISMGDEVIMPSFTFVSTANAFALRGARIKFVDINPKTMNLDENLIEAAITKRTKAIVLVHYAGWSCDLNKVMEIATKYNLMVIEDAAQALGGEFKGKKLGTFGAMSTFSFHETKNIHCGEGGAIVLNNDFFSKRAEIIREKGTNRSQFLRGQTDKYTWVDLGSSFLPSELNAAFLSTQLSNLEKINNKRVSLWNRYRDALINSIEVLECPSYCKNNAHLFAIKAKDIEERTLLIEHLKKQNIQATFHYVPLHSSPAGVQFGDFNGEDRFTTKESSRLVRLPLYYDLSSTEQDKVIEEVIRFYK